MTNENPGSGQFSLSCFGGKFAGRGTFESKTGAPNDHIIARGQTGRGQPVTMVIGLPAQLGHHLGGLVDGALGDACGDEEGAEVAVDDAGADAGGQVGGEDGEGAGDEARGDEPPGQVLHLQLLARPQPHPGEPAQLDAGVIQQRALARFAVQDDVVRRQPAALENGHARWQKTGVGHAHLLLRRSRRKILPTLDLGNSSRNSMYLGRL